MRAVAPRSKSATELIHTVSKAADRSFETEPPPGYIAVGRIVGVWGLKGHVKVEVMTDFPERFSPGARLFLGGEPRRIVDSLPRKRQMLVQLSGVSSPEAGAALRGMLLTIPEKALTALEEGTFYRFEILGTQAEDLTGASIGEVVDLLETGETQTLVIRTGEGGEVLVPFVEEYVLAVDIEGGVIRVDLAALYPTEEPPAP